MIVKRVLLLLAGCLVFLQASSPVSRVAAQQPVLPAAAASSRALLDRYCVGCHNGRTMSGKLRLDTADVSAVGEQNELWEKVIRKFGAGAMPPPAAQRPDKASAAAFLTWLENELERAAAAHPNPGRTETLHRLNRTEYRNAVRDLLGLEMDFSDLLPIDDSGGGNANFDNIAISLRLTQSLMEQYLSVALKVSRIAVGGDPPFSEVVYKVPPGTRQDVHVEGLPFGTRGGLLVTHFFPVDGEDELQVSAGAGRGQIDFAVDGQRVQLLSAAAAPRAAAVYDPDGPPAAAPGSNRNLRLPMKAGPRQIAVAFVKSEGSILSEADRAPFIGGGGLGIGGGPGGPRLAGVDGLTIRGPLSIVGKGDTPTRRRIFVCRPATPAAEEGCAKTIFSSLARRAYRRPITDHDVALLMGIFNEGRAGADFEAGIERGIRAMLVNPNFLFRVEADPSTAANPIYRISDVELASRLSFFLWSSIPDDELLDLAIKGRLKEPAILEQQARRMLKDSRASALTNSFAAQWLRVRNVQAASPVETIFPNFDESLRYALKREIELFFDSIVREDRSVVDLLNADYTYLNERLAKHYGIAGVVGTEFQRVQLSADSPRRGLLGKGLLLLVTSRSTRTSPVSRGKWILENILGTPPPPPLPNIPPLPEQKQADGRVLTVRELMARHRSDAICASCHNSIDPAGFALEQFDAVGKWRTVDAGFQPIDASGVLPDGSKFTGINEFRALILDRREQFVRTLSEKLLMYALGRGTEFYDGPAIRKIVHDAETSGYKFSSVVLGIVKSTPFQMRKVLGAGQTASAAH